MRLGVDRLPRLGVVAVGRDRRRELVDVVQGQRPDRRALAVQADPRWHVAEHGAERSRASSRPEGELS
jgi:hypothetical protein